MAFVSPLVQQGQVPIGIARHEHGQVADLLGLRVYGRQAPFIQRHAQGFQPQVLDVGRAPHGRHHLIDHHGLVAAAHLDAASHLPQLRGCPGVQPHVGFEHLGQLSVNGGVVNAREVVACAEVGHLQPQPCQGLGHFHPQRAHADDGDAWAERGLFKQRVGGEHAVAKGQPCVGQQGARSGGNDDAARGMGFSANFYQPGPQQRGTARLLRAAQVLGGLQGPGDQLIAQCAHPLQHGGQVGHQRRGAAQAQFIPGMAPVKRAGRLDEHLGRHAAHPGARGAPGAVVHDEVAVGALAHLAQGRQPRSARADDDGVQGCPHVPFSKVR